MLEIILNKENLSYEKISWMKGNIFTEKQGGFHIFRRVCLNEEKYYLLKTHKTYLLVVWL